jgi:hypothetical protein
MHLSASSSDLLASPLHSDDITPACIIAPSKCHRHHVIRHEDTQNFFIFSLTPSLFVGGERKEEESTIRTTMRFWQKVFYPCSILSSHIIEVF